MNKRDDHKTDDIPKNTNPPKYVINATEHIPKPTPSISLRDPQRPRGQGLTSKSTKSLKSSQKISIRSRSMQSPDFTALSSSALPSSSSTANNHNAQRAPSWRDLTDRELRLSIKENKVDELQSKNVTFIQSLQKQIDSLSKQLYAERNRTAKHRVWCFLHFTF